MRQQLPLIWQLKARRLNYNRTCEFRTVLHCRVVTIFGNQNFKMQFKKNTPCQLLPRININLEELNSGYKLFPKDDRPDPGSSRRNHPKKSFEQALLF